MEEPRQRGERLELAGVLGAARRYSEAYALYESLIRDFPTDRDVRVGQAQSSLWIGKAPLALKQTEALLAEDFNDPRLWRGYVNAGAVADSLSRGQVQTLQRILEQRVEFNGSDDEAAYLSRMAWRCSAKARPTTKRPGRNRPPSFSIEPPN